MKTDLQNIDQNESIRAFPRIATKYRKGKDEVWAEISLQIEKSSNTKSNKVFHLNFVAAIAASFLLLIGFAGFMRFYTKTVESPAGQHLTVMLPDGSKIELNAQSNISFHPYWWRFSRDIKFSGEGFFEVEKGAWFSVISDKGITTVLGTSFNIFSRGNDYEVTCFTGKVSVSSKVNSDKLVLYPNQQVKLSENGKLNFVSHKDSQTIISWKDNMFTFTSAPLKLVLEEIERQYNIRIINKEAYDFTYTGNFKKEYSEKDVLDLVCTPLGLKFEQKANGEYLVYQN
jgi:ferric-dicitrate binding protein FerR (iron transport regulator)